MRDKSKSGIVHIMMDSEDNSQLIKNIRDFVSNTLKKSGGHGIDHTMRVTRLCEIIGTVENANPEILIPAALLHDIARPLEEEKGLLHEEVGANIAERLLKKLGYPAEYIKEITHAIRTHRYRSVNKPQTLEAMILSDADKLDAIGAVGIARAFMTVGERYGDISDGVDHIHDKLLKLTDNMYTDYARTIAHDRHQILRQFVENIETEMRL